MGNESLGGDNVLDRGQTVTKAKSQAHESEELEGFRMAADRVTLTMAGQGKLIRKRGWPLQHRCSDLRLEGSLRC